jgi:hypothetical protein
MFWRVTDMRTENTRGSIVFGWSFLLVGAAVRENLS